MPTDVGAVDLMIGFPVVDRQQNYDFLKPQLRDQASAKMEFPVEYMFKGVPSGFTEDDDPVEVTLGEMDKHGVAVGLVGVHGETAKRALQEHPDR
ncbi:MAG: amidohydrolase family protein, partial [Actinomycetota bacterium]